MQFSEGQVRIDIGSKSVDFRVMGRNGESGVENALAKVGALAKEMKKKKIRHRADKRKYNDGHRIDAVVVELRPEGRTGTDRRKRWSDRRR